MSWIKCKDGFSMSVVANTGAYCSPRNDKGPYISVEVGFPSAKDNLLSRFAEDRDEPIETKSDGRAYINTVYGWVPSTTVIEVIENHGGLQSGYLPTMITVVVES